MKIAVLGAGFTGLSAAFHLIRFGHAVTVFEKDAEAGGLAVGFKQPEWLWSLEKHYHHWFTNDAHVLALAKMINFPVLIKRPKTSVYIDNESFQLDSPTSLLTFPKINIANRMRMAVTLAFLRYNPYWKLFEKFETTKFLRKYMGNQGYEAVWEPQLLNKFDGYMDQISLAWFWARIKKRTASLAYPQGGFLFFAQKLAEEITGFGGEINYNTEATSVTDDGKKVTMLLLQMKDGDKRTKRVETRTFDKIIVTLPSFALLKLIPTLPDDYKKFLSPLKGLGASNLILRLKEPFLKDGTYWLSICEKNAPVMSIVEHTNFMDKKYYNNEHLVYLGNYLKPEDKRMQMTEKELLKLYDPFLKKINPDYKKSLIATLHFTAPFAQPIIPLNYSKMIPPMKTPLPNVFLSNIQQVYPWDRGTNYAVELGEKVAKLINYQS